MITVVGVGEGGVAALGSEARAVIAAAETVLGPPRLIAGLDGAAQQLIAWQSPLECMLDQVRELKDRAAVVLATGDPSWFGIGATLSRYLAHEDFRILPHPSAFSLAAARLHWPLQNVATLSLHGRALSALNPHILPGNRILALTTDRHTVAAVANLLETRGYGRSRLVALENLGGPAERVTQATASGIDAEALGDFLTLAIDCVAEPGAPLLPAVPGLPDEAFVTDGQITKREVRAATLARLAPYPGALLWDVGAGSGSIAIEWMRSAREASALAFEHDPARQALIRNNAENLGCPGLVVIAGEAPLTFEGQQAPDAVFIGGDVANDAIFAAAWRALKPGGRLVANSVTLEGEQALLARSETYGGELVRIDIAVLDTIGRRRVMRPRLPVLQWAVVRS